MLPVLKDLKYFFLLFNFVTVVNSFEPNTDYQKQGHDFAKKQMHAIKKLNLEEVLEEKDKLNPPKGEAAKGGSCKNCVTNLKTSQELDQKLYEEMDNSQGEQVYKDLLRNGEKLLVFISFSMPNNSIKELSHDSQKYGAQLYLRGIFEKSFKKTAQKILEVNDKGLKLEINPKEFKRYKIEKVPTFVLTRDGKEVSRLAGNVSLEYAISKLRSE